MENIKLLFAVILFFYGCSLSNEISGQSNILPNQYTLLDSTKAEILVSQCSRYAPIIEGSWNPSEQQIKELENHIFKISELTADSCCIIGQKVNDVNKFYRQYVGVIVNGQKLIYINAFPNFEFDNLPKNYKKPDWRKEPYTVCDGGEYYWGVLYNPLTKEFRELAFNGVG